MRDGNTASVNEQPSPTASDERARREYSVSGNVFLRSLALVYLAAFASLAVQIEGLVGSQGILPVAEYLGRIEEHFAAREAGAAYYWRLPTLCWWWRSDTFLNLLCAAGISVSIVAALWPLSVLWWILLWAGYLSLVGAGQVFLGFQWDALLLEVGALAIFLAPMRLPFARVDFRPSMVILWLYRWLLFRFLLTSGIVKLVADEVWRDLTALNYHYETQPLPPWTAWYLHQLPDRFQSASVLVLFFVELIVPVFVFFPRYFRYVAALVIVAFMGLIIVSGNYGFFNLLTIVMCIPLLDDSIWPVALRRKLSSSAGNGERRGVLKDRRTWFHAPLALVVVTLSVFLFVSRFSKSLPWGLSFEFSRDDWPTAVEATHRHLASFRVVNTYGLFANMTEERPEIIVEGSDDGEVWKAYRFKYKPGDLERAPGFVAPHMPRLDWQMWFAALGRAQSNPWFVRFCRCLLEGKEPVLDLLEENPFEAKPPRFVRAVLWDYRFTSFEERRKSGHWWKRTRKGLYLPAVSLEAFRNAERR